jgi:hypothetical protein
LAPVLTDITLIPPLLPLPLLDFTFAAALSLTFWIESKLLKFCAYIAAVAKMDMRISNILYLFIINSYFSMFY